MLGGLGLIAYGSWGVLAALRLRTHGVSTNGFVVRLKTDEGASFPVVEFRAQGKMHQFTSRSPLGPFHRLKVGACVAVLYDEANPKNAVIDSPHGALSGPAGSALVGLWIVTVPFVPYFTLP